MRLPLKLLPAAEADLVNIWLYTFDQWGEQQADKYIDQLESGFAQLKDYPWLGTDYGHVRQGYRKLRIQHHDAFYRVTDSEIQIVRVLHEEMDAPRRLLG